MANLHLVTGHAGKTHVTSADHGSFYAALFGSNNYILDKGSKFAASIISDNLVKIADGDLLMQGRHARIPDNEFVEVVIPNGTQGYKRRDLIVARYTKDTDTGVEEMDLTVLIGEPIAADPQDPAYITGDIIKDGALINDVPLYRVNLDGTTITGVDSLLPAVIPVIPERIEEVYRELSALVNGVGNAKIEYGTYTGTGTYGDSNAITLTFKALPKFIVIIGSQSTLLLSTDNMSTSYTEVGLGSGSYNHCKKSGNSVSFYDGRSAASQANVSGIKYAWIAIG